MEAPDTIYLQYVEGGDDTWSDTTWCDERINDDDIVYRRERTCVWTWSDVDETGQEDGACVTTSCGHRVEPAPGLQIRCHICGGTIRVGEDAQ